MLESFWKDLERELSAAPADLYLPQSRESLLAKLRDSSNGETFRQFQDPDGHITGSAVIVDASKRFMLLIFHPKLKRWLQPGGHVEAGETAFEAARRESLEECGINGLVLNSPRPFDIDVHEIPTGKTPAHKHFDLRYLFIAQERVEGEKEWTAELPCRWVELADVVKFTEEESVLRLARKASKI